MKPSKEDIACLLQFKKLNELLSKNGKQKRIDSVFELKPSSNFFVGIRSGSLSRSLVGYVEGALTHKVSEPKAYSYNWLSLTGKYEEVADTSGYKALSTTPIFVNKKSNGSIAQFYLSAKDQQNLRKAHKLLQTRDLWFEFGKNEVTLRTFSEKDDKSEDHHRPFVIEKHKAFAEADYTAKISPFFLQYLHKEEYDVNIWKGEKDRKTPDDFLLSFLGLDSGLEFTTSCLLG